MLNLYYYSVKKFEIPCGAYYPKTDLDQIARLK